MTAATTASTIGTRLAVLSTTLKILLFPAYRSTDFDVHRNWLRITRELPLQEWYCDTRNQWTLDYPPFFAYFEKVLSTVASVIDPSIAAEGPVTWATVVFQRSSVIVSELVLVAGTLSCTSANLSEPFSTSFAIAASVFFHPGFLIIDHIHFQYNGMLFGLLLLSLAAAKREQYIECAIYFAVLLNFKHIFAYIALPFIVFLFRSHCMKKDSIRFDKLTRLAAVVVGICLLSFGPFVLSGGFDQLRQIFRRLFPFQRGLNHAYWAPNIWALLSSLDRVLIQYLSKRGWPVTPEALNSTSRGLVGDTTWAILPQVTPRTCFAITIAINLIFLTKLWRKPTYPVFVRSVILSAYASFLFGWHVHEKAVMLFLVPLSLVAADDYQHYRAFLVASAAGIYGLFPLLIRSDETVLKIAYTSLWLYLAATYIGRSVYRPTPTFVGVLARYAENGYLCGFVALQFYVSIGHDMLFRHQKGRMEFLPLLLTSVYCSMGVIWSFGRLSVAYLSEE